MKKDTDNDFQLIDNVIDRINKLKEENKSLADKNYRLEHRLRVTNEQNDYFRDVNKKLEERIEHLEKGGYKPIKYQEHFDNENTDEVFEIEHRTVYDDNLKPISHHYRLTDEHYLSVDFPHHIFICTIEKDEGDYKLFNKTYLIEIIEKQNKMIQELQIQLIESNKNDIQS